MTDLPRSKYSDSIHTPGKEFTLNGKEYVGWYVVTYQDRYFSGKVLTKQSKEIFKISTEVSTNVNKVFVSQVVSPSIEERVEGIWKRYFLQKKSSLAIIEVDKERFTAFNRTSGYTQGTVDWVIKGPVQDITKGPYVYRGAEFRNRETITKLEHTIPGISSFIKDYSQFVE